MSRIAIFALLGWLVASQKVPDVKDQDITEDEREIKNEALKEEVREETLRAEFNIYDSNEDDVIDVSDLRSKFKEQIDPEMLFQFFVDADTNQSGTISFAEYADYRRKLATKTK